jgi:hypothetical protein
MMKTPERVALLRGVRYGRGGQAGYADPATWRAVPIIRDTPSYLFSRKANGSTERHYRAALVGWFASEADALKAKAAACDAWAAATPACDAAAAAATAMRNRHYEELKPMDAEAAALRGARARAAQDAAHAASITTGESDAED